MCNEMKTNSNIQIQIYLYFSVQYIRILCRNNNMTKFYNSNLPNLYRFITHYNYFISSCLRFSHMALMNLLNCLV